MTSPRLLATTALVVALLGTLAAAVLAATPDRRFAPAGRGTGELGPHASALAVSDAGIVYAGSPHEGEIEVFSHGGVSLGRVAIPGLRALATDGSRLLVADGAGVHEHDGATLLEASDVAAVAAGGGRVVVARADGLHDADGLFAPLDGVIGVAVAPDGSVLAATGDERVHHFSAAGAPLGDWAAPDVRGIAVAPDGSVLLAQGKIHQIGVHSADGTPLARHTGMNVVAAVAADCRGTIFALDNSDPRGHVISAPGAAAPPCTAEPTPTPSATPVATPTATPKGEVAGVVRVEAPVLGQTQRVIPKEGQVYAGKGKARKRVTQNTILPIGTAIDTSEGTVELEFETKAGADRSKYGRYMSGRFSGGEFTPHQGGDDSLVELHLEGSGVGASTSLAQAAATKKRKSVWSTAKGRFRTVGRHGAATVRGTRWFTEDRADGTFVKVAEGSVAVKDFRTGRTVIVKAGESYLARSACVSRRRFWITLQLPVGARADTAAVRVGGKAARVRVGSRTRALVDLRGARKGTVSVRIRATLRDGRVLTGTRRYATCAAGSASDGKPPLL